VFPGAEELCNDLDDDCDEAVDDDDPVDPAAWYLDADGDGYGDADRSVAGCEGGSGWVDDATDCDDLDPAVYEVANGVDDDCDGLGLHGAYAPTGDTDLSGVREYTTLNIPAGVTVTARDGSPLEIYVLDSAVVAGTIELAGLDGGDGLHTDSTSEPGWGGAAVAGMADTGLEPRPTATNGCTTRRLSGLAWATKEPAGGPGVAAEVRDTPPTEAWVDGPPAATRATSTTSEWRGSPACTSARAC